MLLAGIHPDAATLHGKQRETKKAKGEIARKKKRFPRRAGEEKRKTITETERGKEKDLQNVRTGREKEKESMIMKASCFSLEIGASACR